MIGLDKLGAEAKSRRKALGITQIEASKKSCVHRNDISKIEHGKFTGSILTVANYLEVLGMVIVPRVKGRKTLDDLDDERRLGLGDYDEP